MNNIENQKDYFIYSATYTDYETIPGEEVKKRFGANKIVSVGLYSRRAYNENLRLGLSDDNVVYLISEKNLARGRLDALERNEVCSRETYDMHASMNNNNANLGGRRKSRRTRRNRTKRTHHTRRH